MNFRVSIYESTPGLSQPHLGPGYPDTPATLVAYDTGGKAGESLAGVFGGVAMYDYHFVLPAIFQAQAGKLYWVQIEAEFANGLPYWGFASGTGNGHYFRRVAGQADFYFQYISGDAAFSLLTGDGPIHTIAATAAPVDSGTISNHGLYPEGAAAPLVATPNPGYAFVNWTENGAIVSTNSNFTFTVTGNRTLVANFAAGSLITTASSPLTGGNTDGGGSFVNGSNVTVEAVASANYTFVHWTENDIPVSTAAVYTFPAAGDRDLVAHFTPSAANPGIVFSQPPAQSGTLLLSSYMLPDGNIDGMECQYIRAVFLSGHGGSRAGSPLPACLFPDLDKLVHHHGHRVGGWHVPHRQQRVGACHGQTRICVPQLDGEWHASQQHGNVQFLADRAAQPAGQLCRWFHGGCGFLVRPRRQRQWHGWLRDWRNRHADSHTGGRLPILPLEREWRFGQQLRRIFLPGHRQPRAHRAFPSRRGNLRSHIGSLDLTWPESATGWVLQESPDLSPASWVDSALHVTTGGGQNQVTVVNPTGSSSVWPTRKGVRGKCAPNCKIRSSNRTGFGVEKDRACSGRIAINSLFASSLWPTSSKVHHVCGTTPSALRKVCR